MLSGLIALSLINRAVESQRKTVANEPVQDNYELIGSVRGCINVGKERFEYRYTEMQGKGFKT